MGRHAARPARDPAAPQRPVGQAGRTGLAVRGGVRQPALPGARPRRGHQRRGRRLPGHRPRGRAAPAGSASGSRQAPAAAPRIQRQGCAAAHAAALLRAVARDRASPTSTARGSLGPEAEAALKAFQREHRLDADGVYGPATQHALSRAIQLERARRRAGQAPAGGAQPTRRTSRQDERQAAEAGNDPARARGRGPPARCGDRPRLAAPGGVRAPAGQTPGREGGRGRRPEHRRDHGDPPAYRGARSRPWWRSSGTTSSSSASSSRRSGSSS